MRVRRLLFFSALWIFLCLAAIYTAWMSGWHTAWAVGFELAAGLPLFAWAALLWRGRFDEAGLRHARPWPRLRSRRGQPGAFGADKREETALQARDESESDRPPLHFGRREIALLFALAVILRLVLLPLAPRQSDDLYRYIWEGRVQLAGENPYEHAPLSPALAPLRDAKWEQINHPEHSAIYPPLAQGVFALTAFVSPTVIAFKTVFTFFDLLLLWVLVRWLIRLGRSPAWAVLWAFHPLVIVEFSGNGHLDSLMALMLIASFYLLDRGRENASLAALAGAVAAKLIPLLLLPFYVWRLRRWWPVALVPAAVALTYLPYAGAGDRLWASLWIYQRDWLYNAPVFEFVRDTVFGEDGWTTRYWFYGTLLALMGTLWFWRSGPVAATLPVLGFYQVAGPVVHPWYLCVFIPLVCVRYGAWPWLWLTWAVPAVYLGEANDAIRWFVWGPFLAGLALQGGLIWLRRMRSARADSPGG